MKTGAAAVTLRNHDDDLKTSVGRSHKNSRKRSTSDEDSDAEKGEACAAKKNKKLSWTESLHNRFLEAIRIIGFDRAVPKKIHEVMNVPGLTRDNVASHLQIYRNFLKRACDALQYSVDDTQSSSRHSFSTSSSPSPTSLMLNKSPYQQYSTALRNQSGIFGQPRSMLADKGIPVPGQINRIMTTPSNYVGYDILNLIHLTGNSNEVVPNVIGDYDQLYSNLPNTRNIQPMIHDLEALSDQQPLDQGEHFDTTLGDQVLNIINQAPAQQNEGKTFATTSNLYGDQWDSICVPSFDPAPNKQYCNQDLVNPQDQFATSSGQLINNTSYNYNITTAPSFNYVGYDIFMGNNNAVAPNNVNDYFEQLSIGDCDQLSSSLPNVGNIHRMDKQLLDQAEPFTAILGDLVNILNQAPTQRNEGKIFATTSNFYGKTSNWDPSCVSSFDPAPKLLNSNTGTKIWSKLKNSPPLLVN